MSKEKGNLPEFIRKPVERATGIARNVGIPFTLLFIATGMGALALGVGAATIAAHEANKSLKK
jgi:hypothetical protein